MRIKLIANPKKPWAKELAKEIKQTLAPQHTVVAKGADATICIGGDGTILYANHSGHLEGSILGIGSEKSYVCQLTKDNWKGRIPQILETNKTIKIMTLVAEAGGKDYTALNDFVVHATNYRVAELEVSEKPGQSISFEGDGVIISSALGSTGYAYSAGGEKFRPTERKISVVPICPYRRAFSPNVLSEDGIVEIRVGNDCAFILDGIFIRKLNKGETVRIRKGRDIAFFEGVGTNEFKG